MAKNFTKKMTTNTSEENRTVGGVKISETITEREQKNTKAVRISISLSETLRDDAQILARLEGRKLSQIIAKAIDKEVQANLENINKFKAQFEK